jgi:hypothetical protein
MIKIRWNCIVFATTTLTGVLPVPFHQQAMRRAPFPYRCGAVPHYV